MKVWGLLLLATLALVGTKASYVASPGLSEGLRGNPRSLGGCSIIVLPHGYKGSKTQLPSGVPVASSLVHAQSLLRRGRQEGSVSLEDGKATICLLPGHHLGGVRYTSADSNTVFIAVRPDEAEKAPVVVSGGAVVSGWKKVSKSSPVYTAALPNGVATGRNLWVNGIRLERASIDASTIPMKTTTSGYVISKEIDEWAGAAPYSIEFLYTGPGGKIWPWIQPRCTVKSAVVTKGSTEVTMAGECWKQLKARAPPGTLPPPLTIENAVMPTKAGQFYVDMKSRMVYLYPAAGVDLQSAMVIVGKLESVVTGTHVKGHSWRGMTFAYSTWSGVNTDAGYVDTQTAVYNGSTEPVGAVAYHNSSGISFDSCAWTHHGAIYAVSAGDATHGASIVSSSFTDLSGGAVKFGNVDDTRAVTKDESNWDRCFTLSQSTVRDVSLEYLGAAAVFAGYVAETSIDHNTIHSVGYSGISLGWGWGRVVSFARSNIIVGNHVFDVMKSLMDGGCIYTLGPQPNSTVSYNYAHDDHQEYGVLYHDNGSRYFHTHHNVIDSSPNAHSFFLTDSGNPPLPAQNIRVDNIYIRNSGSVLNNCERFDCKVDNATIVMVPNGGSWPAGALEIIDAAGASSVHDPDVNIVV